MLIALDCELMAYDTYCRHNGYLCREVHEGCLMDHFAS